MIGTSRHRSQRPGAGRRAALPVLSVAVLLASCARRGEEAEGGTGDPVAAFTRHYVESDQGRPFAPRFLGVPSWQNPCDMWVMQEILSEVKPDLIVETGTAHGGSALYYAWVLAQVHPEGRVLTIDVDPQLAEAQQHALFREKVEVLTGSSTAPEVFARVQEAAAGQRVLVTLDSLHGEKHVRAEMALYADLVSPGSYLVVQDTVIDAHPDWVERYATLDGSEAGPAPAVRDFLAAREDFEVDTAREKFLFSFHPGGYLRRRS